MLEDPIAGPLYKTILCRPEPSGVFERWIDGPAPISVSKVNQWVSLFTLVVWLPLAVSVLPAINVAAPLSTKHLSVLFITVLFSGLLLLRTRTHLGDHEHRQVVRRTSVLK